MGSSGRRRVDPSVMRNAENIILIRLKSIGDVLFTLPAAQVLRDNFPAARISFLVSKEHALLLEGFREVDEVISVDRSAYRSGNPVRILANTFATLRRLRRGKCSLAVDLQGYGETALLTWFTRASQRWGMLYKSARAWAYTRGVWRDWRIHPAEWNLSLLEECGLKIGEIRNQFRLPEAALKEARSFFAAQKLDASRPTLFIQPFSSSPYKNWPLEKHLELARHWQTRGVQILFGGGPADTAALQPARSAGFPVSAGASLLVTGGLMKLSSLVVGADTGLLHLAVAMGRRVVMIMVPKAVHATYPFRHKDWIVTPPDDEPVAALETDVVNEHCSRAFLAMKPATGNALSLRSPSTRSSRWSGTAGTDTASAATPSRPATGVQGTT